MLSKYLLEIKNRVALSIATWILAMVVCYVYKNVLLFLLLKVNFKLYNLKVFYFITTNIIDVFSVSLSIGSFISFHCLIIVTLYHFFSFIIPALFNFEYNKLKVIVFTCFLFFYVSISTFHFYILPFLCDFFLTFQKSCSVNIFFESKITEYFNFYKSLYVLIVLIGQLFSVMLVNLLLITEKVLFLRKFRKIIYLGFVFISTVITPPDVFSQVLLSFFFIVNYELFIFNILIIKYKYFLN